MFIIFCRLVNQIHCQLWFQKLVFKLERSCLQGIRTMFHHKLLVAQLYLGHANFSTYSPLAECRGFIPAEVVKDAGLRNKFKAPLGTVGRALFASGELYP